MSQPLYEDYYFAMSEDYNKLERSINERLAMGYVPFGGICVIPNGGGGAALFAQAVAKPISPTSQLQQELKEE